MPQRNRPQEFPEETYEEELTDADVALVNEPEDVDPENEGVTDLAPLRRPRRKSVRAVRAGTGRPEDDPTPGDNELVVDFHRLYASFQIDWTSPDAYPLLGRRSRRAALLGWTPQELASVEQVTGLYSLIPRICPGMARDLNPAVADETEDTPVAERTGPHLCPCVERFGANTEPWKNRPCPNETLTGFRHFVLYIRELGIKPYDHVDIQQVVEICKLHVYEARCDEELQVAGNIYDKGSPAIDQKSGTVYWTKTTPTALVTQGILAKRRDGLYKALVAGRKERFQAKISETKAMAAVAEGGSRLTAAELFAEYAVGSVSRRRALQAEQEAVEAEDDVIDAVIGKPVIPETPDEVPPPAE